MLGPTFRVLNCHATPLYYFLCWDERWGLRDWFIGACWYDLRGTCTGAHRESMYSSVMSSSVFPYVLNTRQVIVDINVVFITVIIIEHM